MGFLLTWWRIAPEIREVETAGEMGFLQEMTLEVLKAGEARHPQEMTPGALKTEVETAGET